MTPSSQTNGNDEPRLRASIASIGGREAARIFRRCSAALELCSAGARSATRARARARSFS